MIKADLDWDYEVLATLNAGIDTAPKEFKKRIRNRLLPRVRRFAKSQLKIVPGPVVYPFKFATARSRAAFFATGGFGKGIPTRRTGATVSGWDVHLSQVGPSFTGSIENARPWARFVYGPNQTPGHARTGWQLADKTVDKISAYADEQAIKIWNEFSEEI